MTRLFCDRCKREAINSPIHGRVSVTKYALVNCASTASGTTFTNEVIKRDLCNDCMEYVQTAFLSGEELNQANRRQR